MGVRGNTGGREAPNDQILRESKPKLANWRSGKFHGWRPIAFELRFETGYEEAREWLHGAAAQYEFERLCQSAREAKNEAA